MPADKINTMEKNMTKLNSNVEHMQKDIREINDKLTDMCEEMENSYVRKDIYETETAHIKEGVAFCKGVIYSGAGVFVLYIVSEVFNLL